MGLISNPLELNSCSDKTRLKWTISRCFSITIKFFYSIQSTHTVKKSKETKIAKHPPRFLIYGAKMLDKGVAASKKILALCLF